MSATTEQRLVQYKPDPNEPLWKVALFSEFSADFRVKEEQLSEFHQLAIRFSKQWEIIRRIFGISPVIVPLDTDAKFLTPQSKFQVAADFGLDEQGLNSEIAVVAAAWAKLNSKRNRKRETVTEPSKATSPLPAAQSTPPPAPPASVPMSDPSKLELLKKFGFSDTHFFLIGRDQNESVAEREWMAMRLEAMQKVLDEPMVASMVLQSLTNEMLIIRISKKLCIEDPAGVQFAKLQETKKTLEREYREQWAQIKESCPWAVQLEAKIQGTGLVSDWIKAIQNHYAKSDNKLLDWLYTALEIQILLRESVQHEIRYRRGQTAYLVEALTPEALFDPNWQSSFTPFQAKQLDEGFRGAAKQFREATGVHLPDLEDKGPAGEYARLYMPGETSADEPSENIQLKT